MRISTKTIQLNSMESMLNQQGKLHKTQLQLASGKRIMNPSDDPTVSALTVEVTQSKKLFTQYQNNITHARNRLSMEDSVLGQATNVLQSLREIAVQGNNSHLGPDQKQGIAVAVRQRLDEMLSLANTVDANGDYLFAGNKGATKPFVQTGTVVVGAFTYKVFGYDGDQGHREIKIGPERTVADSDSGFEAFIDLRDANGAQKDIFAMIDEFAVALETNTMTSKHIGDMDQAINRLTEIRAKVGARLNVLDNQESVNGDFIMRLTSVMSEMHDLDYAEAVTRMNMEMVGLEAAQKSYGKIQGLALFNYI